MNSTSTEHMVWELVVSRYSFFLVETTMFLLAIKLTAASTSGIEVHKVTSNPTNSQT